MEADGAAPSSGGTNSPSFADRVRRLWSRAADPADPAEAAPSADSNLNLVAAAPLTDGGAAGDVAEAAGPAHPPAKAASGVFAVLASSTSSAVERAAHYLPASLSLRRRGGAGAAATQPPPPPPPLSVPVQLLCGDEVPASATAATTLEELRQACGAAAGVPPPLIRICVQEEQPQSSLGGLLRAASRRQVARSLQDLTAFLLVPEGLGRELRGQGLAAWARENVTHQLWAPPPGTVRVLVVSLDGCRCSILLRGAATLADLRQEVQRQAGVAADRQRLLALQQRALSPAQRLALAALRLLVAAALWAAGWLAAAARWLLDLPPAEASLCSLALVTESGRRVELAVGPDTTLAQLQERVFQRYGEHVSLSHLCVSPERGGGGG